jgi:hypothetical protein
MNIPSDIDLDPPALGRHHLQSHCLCGQSNRHSRRNLVSSRPTAVAFMNRPPSEIINKKLELGDMPNADGDRVAVYGYRIKHLFIYDPRSSECGRLEVDPLKAYGLSFDELTALDAANLRLHGEVPRMP